MLGDTAGTPSSARCTRDLDVLLIAALVAARWPEP
jgi:hypothetical protein